ncbi:MAG: hypothetical protein ACOC2Y_06745 [Spirochaetota bacterium]
MKRFPRRLLVALLLVCIYVVWHPDPTGTELTVRPAWAVSPASAELSVVDGGSARLPVVLDSVFGYLDADGRLVYRGRVAHRVALSSHSFINYSRTPAQLIVQDSSGEFRSSIPLAGYPVFVEGRLFVVSDGGGAVSEWSRDGRRLWGIELPSPLSAIDASPEYAALGLVAGGALVVGRNGERIEMQRPSAVAQPLVQSVALSGDPPRFAVISAQPRPRETHRAGLAATVTVYDLTSGSGTPVVRRSIAADGAGDPLVALLNGGRTLAYSTAFDSPALVGLDIETGDEFRVPLAYPAADSAELGEPDLTALLATSRTRDPARAFARPSELVFVSDDGLVPIRISWAADATAMRRFGSRIVVRADDRLLGFGLGVE